jgi:ubiquinone biosynthesis protein UbiJ
MIDPTITFPAYKALESAINLAAQTLPEVQQELKQHQHKVIGLHCRSPQISVYIDLSYPCKVLHHSDQVDVDLEGELDDWLAFIRASDRGSQLINGNITINGDSQWLTRLGHSINEIDIDWEDELAKLIGDVPAHVISRAGKKLTETAIPIIQNLKDPAKEIFDSALHKVRDGLDKRYNKNPET